MSKKLLIILISVVAVLGGIVTTFFGVYYSPLNKAKRALNFGYNASKIEIVLNQFDGSENVYRSQTQITKKDDGYAVKVLTTKLNSDPLSPNKFIMEENSYELENLNLNFYNLKGSYLTGKIQDGNNFFATVKENKIANFFSKDDGLISANLQINYVDKAVNFYKINFENEQFSYQMTMTFTY